MYTYRFDLIIFLSTTTYKKISDNNDKQSIQNTFEIIFRQAFIGVERGYMDSIGDLLAERMSLQFDIPDGLSAYEAYQKFPNLVSSIDKSTFLNM